MGKRKRRVEPVTPEYPDRDPTPAEQERQHYAALADRYRHALEAAHDALAGGPFPQRSTEARAIVAAALEPDPRPGAPTDRQHWAHMQDGDKLVWRLVAELVELRDAQAVTVGAPTLKHHSFQNDRVEIDVGPDAPNPEWERFLDGLSIEELRRRITAQKQMLVETVANGEAALDAERTSKLDVVRHLRMRIGEARAHLAAIPRRPTSADRALNAALHEVFDPDDNRVH